MNDAQALQLIGQKRPCGICEQVRPVSAIRRIYRYKTTTGDAGAYITEVLCQHCTGAWREESVRVKVWKR